MIKLSSNFLPSIFKAAISVAIPIGRFYDVR